MQCKNAAFLSLFLHLRVPLRSRLANSAISPSSNPHLLPELPLRGYDVRQLGGVLRPAARAPARRGRPHLGQVVVKVLVDLGEAGEVLLRRARVERVAEAGRAAPPPHEQLALLLARRERPLRLYGPGIKGGLGRGR